MEARFMGSSVEVGSGWGQFVERVTDRRLAIAARATMDRTCSSVGLIPSKSVLEDRGAVDAQRVSLAPVPEEFGPDSMVRETVVIGGHSPLNVDSGSSEPHDLALDNFCWCAGVDSDAQDLVALVDLDAP